MSCEHSRPKRPRISFQYIVCKLRQTLMSRTGGPSRPLRSLPISPKFIFITSVVQKCKLMRTAAVIHSRRKDLARRRFELLESLGNKYHTDMEVSSEIEMTLIEMFEHENKMYEQYSSDIVSPTKAPKGDLMFSSMESAITL